MLARLLLCPKHFACIARRRAISSVGSCTLDASQSPSSHRPCVLPDRRDLRLVSVAYNAKGGPDLAHSPSRRAESVKSISAAWRCGRPGGEKLLRPENLQPVLQRGSSVRLHGLTGAVALNGQRGVCLAFDDGRIARPWPSARAHAHAGAHMLFHVSLPTLAL